MIFNIICQWSSETGLSHAAVVWARKQVGDSYPESKTISQMFWPSEKSILRKYSEIQRFMPKNIHDSIIYNNGKQSQCPKSRKTDKLYYLYRME